MILLTTNDEQPKAQTFKGISFNNQYKTNTSNQNNNITLGKFQLATKFGGVTNLSSEEALEVIRKPFPGQIDKALLQSNHLFPIPLLPGRLRGNQVLPRIFHLLRCSLLLLRLPDPLCPLRGGVPRAVRARPELLLAMGVAAAGAVAAVPAAAAEEGAQARLPERIRQALAAAAGGLAVGALPLHAGDGAFRCFLPTAGIDNRGVLLRRIFGQWERPWKGFVGGDGGFRRGHGEGILVQGSESGSGNISYYYRT